MGTRPPSDPSSPSAVAAAAFPTARKGFDPDSVRDFLRQVAGELRRVRDLPQRIAEAARLGFKVAVVPRGRPLESERGIPSRRTVDGLRVVEVDGTELAIVSSAGEFYAIADECSHAAIPLSEGDVGDGEIECYLHGSRFDLRTGEPLGLPATEPVRVYPCQVSGDDVLVDVTSPLKINS